MKKSLRYITLILAAIFLISGLSLVAYADVGPEDGGEPVGDDGGEIIVPPVDPGVDPVEVPDDGGYDNPVDVDPGYSEPDYGDSSIEPVDGGNNGSDYNNTDGGYYEPSQVTYDEDPIYYGDASNYDYNASSDNNRDAGSVNTQLYPTKIDNSDAIKAQKWENLELPNDSKNVKLNSGNANGDVSFKSMKTNNASGDDMGYIPYIGVALVALAVLGILYFIIATVTQRRSKSAQAAVAYGGGYSDNSAAYTETRHSDTGRGRGARFADDYEDGYSATRKGSKADTGEIHLPRRFR